MPQEHARTGNVAFAKKDESDEKYNGDHLFLEKKIIIRTQRQGGGCEVGVQQERREGQCDLSSKREQFCREKSARCQVI